MNGAVAILVAAGSSGRMGFPKLTARLPGGETALSLSVRGLIQGGVDAIVFVVSEDTKDAAQIAAETLPIPCTFVPGGETRQESVRFGLAAAAAFAPEIAVIHDAARCMCTPALVRDCILSARKTGSGIAAVPARDTVLLKGPEGEIGTLPRDRLICTQTPQVFRYRDILAAHAKAAGEEYAATDDCSIYAKAGFTPTFVTGSDENFKLTTPADFARLSAMVGSAVPAVGIGEDVHRLVEGRPLILGGVTIPYEKGLLGHSDADALAHAVMDAILGAAGLRDIGQLFPDTDPAYGGANSMALLHRAMEQVRAAGFSVINVDATIVAQAPKMAPHIPAMRENLSTAMGISPAQVNVKATTTEGLGPEGEGKCIRATAAALLRK